MDQIVFNIIFGVAGALCMFVLMAVWNKLAKLEQTDKELTDSVNKLNILIVGDYVKRIDLIPQLKEIYEELKNIRLEMANKAERRED